MDKSNISDLAFRLATPIQREYNHPRPALGWHFYES